MMWLVNLPKQRKLLSMQRMTVIVRRENRGESEESKRRTKKNKKGEKETKNRKKRKSFVNYRKTREKIS